MSTRRGFSVLLVGGPDAGKSNYLFRLWLALEDGRRSLVKSGLPDELEYLRSGAEFLLQGQFAPRTSKEVHERVDIPLESPSGELGRLIVPDLAGERVLAVCDEREWSAEWESEISESCSCLVLVRADSIENVIPMDLMTCFNMYGGPPPESAAEGGDPPLPTQVVLVEWLQFLRIAYTAKVSGGFRPRIAIVVSAWDAVPADLQAAGPTRYLRENFPMLAQYVEANGAMFDFETFGLSVVSGDLEHDDDFRNRYVAGQPQDFGYVVHSLDGPRTKETDVTVPVAWALGLRHRVP